MEGFQGTVFVKSKEPTVRLTIDGTGQFEKASVALLALQTSEMYTGQFFQIIISMDRHMYHIYVVYRGVPQICGMCHICVPHEPVSALVTHAVGSSYFFRHCTPCSTPYDVRNVSCQCSEVDGWNREQPKCIGGTHMCFRYPV